MDLLRRRNLGCIGVDLCTRRLRVISVLRGDTCVGRREGRENALVFVILDNGIDVMILMLEVTGLFLDYCELILWDAQAGL